MLLRAEAEELINEAGNLGFAPTLFQFATEKVIVVALDILKDCRRFTTVR
jgi:hypothetical protein